MYTIHDIKNIMVMINATISSYMNGFSSRMIKNDAPGSYNIPIEYFCRINRITEISDIRFANMNPTKGSKYHIATIGIDGKVDKRSDFVKPMICDMSYTFDQPILVIMYYIPIITEGKPHEFFIMMSSLSASIKDLITNSTRDFVTHRINDFIISFGLMCIYKNLFKGTNFHITQTDTLERIIRKLDMEFDFDYSASGCISKIDTVFLNGELSLADMDSMIKDYTNQVSEYMTKVLSENKVNPEGDK